MQYVLILLSAALLAACGKPGPDEPASPGRLGFDPVEFSRTVEPKDDFFEYVNGPWLEATEIPPEWSSYGVMQVLFEQTEIQLRDIIETMAAEADAPPASDAGKIGGLYRSFMDEDQVDILGLTPLDAEFARIDALASHEEIVAYLGHALTLGVQVPVNFYVDGDAANPDRYLAYIWQDGLGMPDRDYYLQDSAELAQVRDAYRAHVQRMFELAGWPDGAIAADGILSLERRIAERHWTRVQNRDRQRIYSSKYDLPGATALSPNFDWPGFLAAGGFGAPEQFIIAQTDYFAALGALVSETPVPEWRAYLRFKLLKAFAPYLSADFVREDFAFERGTLRGQQELRPRWKRGIALVNDALGELVGKHYVERHFPAASRAHMEGLVENLRTAFRQSIDDLDWMTDATKEEARRKLASFTAKIGYPDKWRDYSALDISGGDLVGNVMRARSFEHYRHVAKLDGPVDRDEWGMTPQTVNAYYRATLNEIVFPAAILQPPFFDPAADDALNYGAIGAVIGHEFSHGFDDQGRKFDGEGRLRDWWTETDAVEYQASAGRLVDQYAQYQPLPDVSIDGELTLGENIADLAGVQIAYRAYQLSLGGQPPPVIGAFTGDHRFFIGYAQAWRARYRDEMLRNMLLSDPHAPARYRVNGVLRNLPEFHRAFAVTSAKGMWLPPEERVSLW
jgi:putative endopeptidase